MKSQILQKKSKQLLEQSITNQYDLCDFCLGRLFSKKNKQILYHSLGKKMRSKLSLQKSKKCYICKNLFEDLELYLQLLLAKSSNYQFKTFVLGTIIKPSLSERDDFIKSRFKIRAVDSLKSSITKELSRKFSRKSRSALSNLDPELTLTVNLKTHSCELRTKPIYLYCRYTKHKRGLTQKQSTCENCNGKGCISCKNHGIVGSDSVEGKISDFLYRKFHTDRIKVNWVGGEDKSSLVLGKGRPVFVKILNPLKRNIRFPKNVKLDGVILSHLKIIKDQPSGSKQFKSSVLLNIETKDRINSEHLKKIKNITNKPVKIFEKNGKTNQKYIYRINYKKNGNNSLIVTMLTDGGLPIKRFVEGRDLSPSISSVIRNNSKCIEFDFKQIYLST